MPFVFVILRSLNFFEREGIRDNSQKNGMAERKIGHILENSRPLLLQGQ